MTCARAKRMGISDERLAAVWELEACRSARGRANCAKKLGVKPVYKMWILRGRVRELHAVSLLRYDEEDEAAPTDRKKIMILGSGPNRIGQGIEFDYCCCHAAFALQRRWLRDDHGQLQSGDRLDRLRHQRPPLLRAADA